MLADAMRNVLQVDAVVGAVALLVGAKDEEAKRFYLKYGFLDLPDAVVVEHQHSDHRHCRKRFRPAAGRQAGVWLAITGNREPET